QAEDGIRDFHVTGVQTCALPISIQPPYAKDAPFQLQPTEFPPPGPYEVLLSISAAGVNRADVVQRAGNYPAPPGASQILGLECAGEVMAKGEAVEGVQVGDRVMALLDGGGYATHVAVDYRQVWPLPKNYSFVEGAAFAESHLTACHNLLHAGELKAGE